MGLFNKKGGTKSKQDKSADVKAPKEAKGKLKGKKSLFGGKKKEMTLLERMQLEESVAAASLDVVQELAELGGSAVRELDEGLLIVAVTNDMFEEAGLDPSGEEFGSFAQALRSETVESIALADDLAAGVIGIIPSHETLLSLDEFDFVHETAFHWALVPFDLDDDDRLTVLDSTVHIEQLVEMANDPEIQFTIENGEVVETGGVGHVQSAPSSDMGGIEDDEDDYDEMGQGYDELDDEEDELDVDSFDMPVGSDDFYDEGSSNADFDNMEPLDDGFDDDFDDNFDDQGYEGSFDDEMHDEPDLDMDEEESYVATTASYPEEEGMSAEESKEAINRVVSHGFNNTELDLSIDMTKFDDYFDSVSIARFDTTRTDNSELQNILSKLRQDANVELGRFHQDNVQALRNKFTTSLRDIHNKLVESLDHKDENTTYGRRKYEIESEFEDAIDDLDRRVAGEIDQINKEYNESREEYAENAKREALAVYDSRHRDERNRKVDSVKDNVHSDLKTTRDTELGELYKDRRTVAQRLFDKATTALLQRLQEEYQAISQKELQMYDSFRKGMDAYLRKHFADEVLRSKAEAEKLKQSHEAERVRTEYEQMLITKTRQIQEADQQSRDALRQLESTHKEQLEHVTKDYERRLEREESESQKLREMLENANASNSKIGEQKEEEVKHRMKMYEDALEGKTKELEYANDRANKAQKPMKFMIGAVAITTLVVGILFGFLFGTNSMQIAPAPNEAQSQNNQPVSFYNEAPSEAVTAFNYHIAA